MPPAGHALYLPLHAIGSPRLLYGFNFPSDVVPNSFRKKIVHPLSGVPTHDSGCGFLHRSHAGSQWAVSGASRSLPWETVSESPSLRSGLAAGRGSLPGLTGFQCPEPGSALASAPQGGDGGLASVTPHPEVLSCSLPPPLRSTGIFQKSQQTNGSRGLRQPWQG